MYPKFLMYIILIVSCCTTPSHPQIKLSKKMLPSTFANETAYRVACATFLQLAISSGSVFIYLLRKAYVATTRSNDITELAKVINKALGAKTDEPSQLIKMSILFLSICIVSSGITYFSYQTIKEK